MAQRPRDVERSRDDETRSSGAERTTAGGVRLLGAEDPLSITRQQDHSYPRPLPGSHHLRTFGSILPPTSRHSRPGTGPSQTRSPAPLLSEPHTTPQKEPICRSPTSQHTSFTLLPTAPRTPVPILHHPHQQVPGDTPPIPTCRATPFLPARASAPPLPSCYLQALRGPSSLVRLSTDPVDRLQLCKPVSTLQLMKSLLHGSLSGSPALSTCPGPTHLGRARPPSGRPSTPGPAHRPQDPAGGPQLQGPTCPRARPSPSPVQRQLSVQRLQPHAQAAFRRLHLLQLPEGDRGAEVQPEGWPGQGPAAPPPSARTSPPWLGGGNPGCAGQPRDARGRAPAAAPAPGRAQVRAGPRLPGAPPARPAPPRAFGPTGPPVPASQTPGATP